MSSLGSLNTALRGLTAHQRALDVTGHNIGNVNTEGYTRQDAILTATTPRVLDAGVRHDGGGAQLGQGVDVLELRRSRDLFLDLQARAARMEQGKQETAASALGRAQSLLHEPGETGIAALLDGFWSSWSTLAANPESAAAKAAVLGAGQSLAGAVNELSTGLSTLRTVAGQELTQLTAPSGPVQQPLQEIARLNASIRTAQEAGQAPNDLLDRRDVLLDQLSTYGQVTTGTSPSGDFTVALDGQPIVAGATFTWPSPYTATSGKLGQLQTLSGPGGPLAAYGADLDTFAQQLVASVNGLQPTPFFSGTSAATLAVAPGADPAASSGAAGDNDLATSLARLRGQTAHSSYTALVARIGGDAAQADRAASNARAAAAGAEERRQSISGVSLDEEMTNLIRFQRGYQAAARVMSTMDEALDVLINRTGRVGL